MHKYHLAALVSAFKGLCALALIPLVLTENWRFASMALMFAILADIGDGTFARSYPAPEGHWARRRGKLLNDVTAGVLSWTAPGSILLWLLVSHPDSDSVMHSGWFWSWVGACIVFVLGTLWFNHHKGARYDIDHRVRAEVMQGWFYGLLLAVCLVQVEYLYYDAYGGYGESHNPVNWLFLGFWGAVVVYLARHRWSDRPETRAAAAMSLEK